MIAISFGTARIRAVAFLSAGALGLFACSRVPDAALRDEQARSRRYRDAYETQAGELQELRKRLATAEKRAATCGGPGAQAAPPALEKSDAAHDKDRPASR